MLRTLRSQYLVGSITTFVLMFGLLAWNAVHLTVGALQAQADEQAQALRPILSAAIAPLLAVRDHATLQQVVNASASAQGLLFITVHDSNGRVVANSGRLSTSGQPVVETPLAMAGQPLGTVRFALNLQPIEEARRKLLQSTWLIAMLVAVAGLGLLLIGTRALSAGFERLANASRRVADGDFDVHLPDSRVRELHLVADSFNRMAGAVRSQLVALRHSEQALEQRVDERTAQLRQAVAEAEQANHAKSRFLSRMSHELRTPLNAVLGFAQLLQIGNRRLDAEQREQADQIVRAGWHLLEMINDVLDVSRIEAGEMDVTLEAVPLAEVVDQAVTMLAESARNRGVEVTDRSAAGSPWVTADRRRLLQVMSNLIGNAIKYNRADGAVTITAEHLENGRVAVRVSDTGCGFTDDERARLFEPFTRFERPGENGSGTGIGLMICRQLTQLMGGELSLDTSPGRGSCFSVVLAAAVPGPLRDGTAEPALVASPRPPRRVLYIEDNPTNAIFVEAALAAHGGYLLTLAADGESGLALALASPPDLALVDIGLPGIDGNEVCRRLRANPDTRRLPLVAFSANAMPDDIARSMAAGFDRYLAKPAPLETLYECLDELIGATAAHDRPALPPSPQPAPQPAPQPSPRPTAATPEPQR